MKPKAFIRRTIKKLTPSRKTQLTEVKRIRGLSRTVVERTSSPSVRRISTETMQEHWTGFNQTIGRLRKGKVSGLLQKKFNAWVDEVDHLGQSIMDPSNKTPRAQLDIDIAKKVGKGSEFGLGELALGQLRSSLRKLLGDHVHAHQAEVKPSVPLRSPYEEARTAYLRRKRA